MMIMMVMMMMLVMLDLQWTKERKLKEISGLVSEHSTLGRFYYKYF